MVRFAGTKEDKAIVGIPLVVSPPIVAIQPQIVVITIHVEDVRVAVRVVMCEVPSVSPPLEGYIPISGLYGWCDQVFGTSSHKRL
jgi:hypothetical protein